MALTEQKTALNRLMDYCKEEAEEMNLPFVVYCISMAKASLDDLGVERAVAGWPGGGAARSRDD